VSLWLIPRLAPIFTGHGLLLALAARAAVLLRDKFVEACRFPFRVKLHFEVFRPWRGEDIRIVDSELVGDCVWVDMARARLEELATKKHKSLKTVFETLVLFCG
jgi:hypothetical protein